VPSGGVRSVPLMGTVVTIEVPGPDEGADAIARRDAALDRAFDWCRLVEARCSRFDPNSELSRLSASVGVAVNVSDLVFRALEFACALAVESGGAFDPTVGAALAAAGFDRHYETGVPTASPVAAEGANYRDVILDPSAMTVTVQRPLQLDLGAVAKGLAVDLAARELQSMEDFAIDAGGDLYVAGEKAPNEGWTIGVRHPREPGAVIGSVRLSNRAICTSGNYERASPSGRHHLIDPATGQSADDVASVTVMARSAMVADGLATAAFVLGPVAGAELLARTGVDGLIVSPDLTLTFIGDMRDAFLSYT
jgi:thiamine biosynthesis lipoprotein